MSHEINKQIDRVVTLEKAWHGLEEIVPNITFGNSGHDFEIVERPIFDDDAFPIPGFKCFKCSDNGHVLHISKESYTPIQPKRLWELIVNSLQDVPHVIASAGSIQSRAKLFISVDIKDGTKFKEGYMNYFNFVMGNDGAMGVMGMDSSIRIVCANTVNASMAQKHNWEFKIKHTKNNEAKLQGMEKFIEDLQKDRASYYDQLDELHSIPCSSTMAEKLTVGFIYRYDKVEEVTEISTRTRNQADRIIELFDSGAGNRGESMRDLFDGVTDYYSHESSGKAKDGNRFKQFVSSEFGVGARNKADMFSLLVDEKERKTMEKRGDLILSNT